MSHFTWIRTRVLTDVRLLVLALQEMKADDIQTHDNGMLTCRFGRHKYRFEAAWDEEKERTFYRPGGDFYYWQSKVQPGVMRQTGFQAELDAMYSYVGVREQAQANGIQVDSPELVVNEQGQMSIRMRVPHQVLSQQAMEQARQNLQMALG